MTAFLKLSHFPLLLFQIKQIPSAMYPEIGIQLQVPLREKKKVDYYNKVCDENFKLGWSSEPKVVIKG